MANSTGSTSPASPSSSFTTNGFVFPFSRTQSTGSSAIASPTSSADVADFWVDAIRDCVALCDLEAARSELGCTCWTGTEQASSAAKRFGSTRAADQHAGLRDTLWLLSSRRLILSLFDNLFVPLEHQNLRSIDSLRTDTASNSDITQSLVRRVDQLELINRALVGILKKRGLLSDAELDLMAQQVDLADGVEDGRVSRSVIDTAPTCTNCGRFVNPRRKACVYCEAPLTKKTAKAPVRTVSCASCSQTVSERSTYFSNLGVVCTPCFATLDE